MVDRLTTVFTADGKIVIEIFVFVKLVVQQGVKFCDVIKFSNI